MFEDTHMSASLDAKSEALENWQKHTIKLFVSFIVRAMFAGSFSSSNLSRVGISFVRFQLNLMTFFVLSLVLGLMALKMMPMQKHSAMIFTSFLVKNSNCIKEYVVAMVLWCERVWVQQNAGWKKDKFVGTTRPKDSKHSEKKESTTCNESVEFTVSCLLAHLDLNVNYILDGKTVFERVYLSSSSSSSWCKTRLASQHSVRVQYARASAFHVEEDILSYRALHRSQWL